MLSLPVYGAPHRGIRIGNT